MKALGIFFLALAGCATGSPLCERDYAALKEAEIVDMRAGEAVLKRVLVDGASEASLTPAETAAVEKMEAVQESRDRVVDEQDVAILDRAAAILSGPVLWDRADDRICGADDSTFSLFCAPQRASEEVSGSYEHRRTALQEVRFAIEDLRPGVEYDHRLRDFNNEARTTFAEIKMVLSTARTRVADRLARQRACAA